MNRFMMEYDSTAEQMSQANKRILFIYPTSMIIYLFDMKL